MGSIYVVTGGNGFLGNHIVRKLVLAGRKVRAFVLPDSSVASLNGLDCEIYYGDVTKEETLRAVFEIPKGDELIVIHCAAVVYIKDRPNDKVREVNVLGTRSVVNKCIENHARLICINSVHAIPEPEDDREIVEVDHFCAKAVTGIYAKSKAEAAELVIDCCKNKGLNATIIQPSGMIGPMDYSMTHMTKLIISLAKGTLPAIVKGGYDFVDVRDVADGVIAAIDKGKAGECYILSNRYVTIKEISDMVSEKCFTQKKRFVLPISVAKFFAPFCEAYYNLKKETPLYTRYSLYTLQAKSNFSHEKASAELGYKPRSLKETISDMIDWYMKTGENR